MTKFESLTEDQREAVCAAVAEALDDARDIPCSWCGVSGDDACDYDFPHVRHDPDRVKEIAAAAINSVAPLPACTTDVGRRVVMAAVRYPTGHVIVGARHFDALMHKQIDALGVDERDLFRFSRDEIEQGFVDQRGVFMGRVEAMAVARAAGQILRLCGADDWLCSEHLY